MRSLFIGRWQPLHRGHIALVQSAVENGHDIIIGIRDTAISVDNPYTVDDRAGMIKAVFQHATVFVVPDFDEICYGRKVGYSFRQIQLDKDTEDISGTKTRERVRDHQELGYVVWFVGLPSAGKTTLADEVSVKLREQGHMTARLDGDVVRKTFSADLGYSAADRTENLRRTAVVANALAGSGIIVLCSFITPYESQLDMLHSILDNLVVVHVDCPLEECVRRDVKGMYRRALDGEIEQFTGIDDVFEPPMDPDVVCNTNVETLEESACKVVEYLKMSDLL